MKKFTIKRGYDGEFLQNGIEGMYLDSLMISGYSTYFILEEAGKAKIFETYNFEPGKGFPKLLK